ncbi:thiamine-binding protein [Filobacillus milosensis]|uniref:Thiamine-binding protein n=1 Tax=Filobacillus milosensis TaxID=94137 RepID=A0A4Y8IB78_9BACI|nr:MTH1187 family thiamine-binding protein [Filobacillus milosensis]TFB13115.1 thiamine-binding protein [Filobacillus milosensis]
MANALLSVQIIPKTQNNDDVIPYVDEAIKVIDESGVKYQVNPLETTMEGELTELLAIVEKMNEKMVEVGCPSVMSQIKIVYNPKGASMDALTEKYKS